MTNWIVLTLGGAAIIGLALGAYLLSDALVKYGSNSAMLVFVSVVSHIVIFVVLWLLSKRHRE
ncbi:MAG: hypothetical protein HND42_01615 [Armatimonadetes bacterium]|nr:hypothetical protein [Armatimonadota bacterium]